METAILGSNSDKDLQAGQKVGEYVIDGKIGEGGFGTVFKASHPLIGKVAAVKVLNRQYSADPEMVSRFVAEARAVNQIRHRNIIDIFAFGQIEDGRSYYVMEFLDGEPLDEFLSQGGAVPLGEAIPILRAVARALDAAHAKGIAHRDLKPENIFLARESDGTIFPKLLDFGIAKLLGTASNGAMHKTRTGAPIGTPYYMSPEQCRGRDVDHRTDIYAFGVVAYKLLTGVVPFDGEDYMDILLKQMMEEPVPPSQKHAGLPLAVDDAIAWMMKKDPAARPPNLITAMRALEEAAVAAGVELQSDPQTGLHASQTSRVAAQRTPSAITPLPRPTSSAGAKRTPSADSFAGAATIDAARLSDAMEARAAAPTPSPSLMDPPVVATKKKSPLLWILALVGAIGVGTVVFFAVRPQDHRSHDDTRTAAGEQVASASASASGTASAAAAVPVAPAGSGSASGSASASAAIAVPVAPKLVTITVSGPPAGTEVYGAHGLIGVVPGDIQLDRSDDEMVLTFKADGYETASQKVTPTADQKLDVKLDKKAAPVVVKTPPKGGKTGKGSGSGSGSGGHDSIEDPFGGH